MLLMYEIYKGFIWIYDFNIYHILNGAQDIIVLFYQPVERATWPSMPDSHRL